MYSSKDDDYPEVLAYCERLRNKFPVVSVFDRQKNLSSQLDKLKKIGFTHWGFYKGSQTQISEMKNG